MQVREEPDAVVVEADAYRLEVWTQQPMARLYPAGGGDPMRLMLLAALDTDRGADGTARVASPTIERGDGEVVISMDTTSTIWDSKLVRLRCTETDLAFDVTVAGVGRLAQVRLLGGWYSGNPRWGGGIFHSQWPARTLFDPSPDDPKRIVQPASETASIGVVGGSLPGRGHWFFTPAPLLFAGTPSATADPDGAAPWTTLELRCDVEAATFSEARYAAFLGGFSVELAYEGETVADGTFSTPPLVITPDVADPYAALARHGEVLRATGLAPLTDRRTPEWWTRPIFCGWGEQCRQAKLSGAHPTNLSRRERYDEWLGILRAYGVVPGTIVIDDKWQSTYGRNEPDAERWPDLRGWIADRHADGQRVLLWFKAWDPEGLPPDACVTDALGQPVAADPASAAYEAILRDSLRAMLGADGLAADGLKVDFTAQTPSGPGLHRSGSEWGLALLHRLLALVYRFAKEANPEALVVTHTASPLFADVTDMIRLNDLLRLDDPDPFAPAVPQMRHRARVAASVEPGMLIDTDDWCMPSKAEWRSYLSVKPELGVPALYYATGIDHSGEAFDHLDYEAIRDAWARWASRAEAQRVQDD
ncbi:MAG TPA: hypothetical protein VJ975_06800 [Candidatus Limnocylindria bacterium]|nr:hypothetical protein [Candidatus Limnocylindria bacterium]